MDCPIYTNLMWWRSICERALFSDRITGFSLTELRLSNKLDWGSMYYSKEEREGHLAYMESVIEEGNYLKYTEEQLKSCHLYTCVLSIVTANNSFSSFEIGMVLDPKTDIDLARLEKVIFNSLYSIRTDMQYHTPDSEVVVRH